MSASEKQFVTFNRGQIRDDVILAKFRDCLRNHVNPTTGATFTEDEIARATQPGSRFWIEAEAVDILGQAHQSRAEWAANQQIPSRAARAFLDGYHGVKWLGEDSRLGATGAAGEVEATANVGAIFPGSTTPGDPTAAVATDPNGYQYQVTEDITIGSTGSEDVPMQAIDTGEHTNIPTGTILTWSANYPLSAAPSAPVLDPGFDGGFPEETDQEYAERIEDRQRHRPASGNPAHFLAWAREANVGIEYAFVYPAALNLGTVMVCIVGKRSSGVIGPDIRLLPGKTVMADATNYLVPPNSPVVPDEVLVVVVKPNPQPANISIRLDMKKGSSGGWYDTNPWPNPTVAQAQTDDEMVVHNVMTTTMFQFHCVAGLPGDATILSGDDAPSLMAWDPETSSFEQLNVSQILKSGTLCTVILSTAPTNPIAVGTRISPYTEQYETLVAAVVSYFDELGPGELYDLDVRAPGDRGRRFPRPNENGKYPSRVGQSIAVRVIDAMGDLAPDASLSHCSQSEPDLPGDIIDGPNMLTLGALTLIPL